MKRLFPTALLFCMALLAFESAHAYNYTLNYGNTFFDEGVEAEVPGLIDYATFGHMMAGMMLTVTYASGGGQDAAEWEATGPGSGAATGSGWSLSQSGDTYNIRSYWNLVVSSGYAITSLYIEGLPGNTVFDHYKFQDDYQDTPNSKLGWPFTPIGSNFNVSAYYRNIVSVEGASPVGDLYADLELIFPSAFSGTFVFEADTDTTTDYNVPLPASALMLVSGLLAFIGIRRGKTR